MSKLYLFLGVCLIVVLCCTKPCYTQTVALTEELNKKLPAADLISDLDFIMAKVADKGDDRTPYNFVPEADFKLELKKVKEYFTGRDSASRAEFYDKVGPLLTLLRDDHLILKLNGKWVASKTKNSLTTERFVFPLSFLVYTNSCYVAASDCVPVKAKVTSINGVAAMDIVNAALKHVSSSEYNIAAGDGIVSFDFPKYAFDVWALFKFENTAKIKYIPSGSNEEKEVTVNLYPFLDRNMNKTLKLMPVSMDKAPSLSFKNDIAVLRLPNFIPARNPEEIKSGVLKWIEFFDKSFGEIIAKNPKKLLIDIGNNGGGSELVGYILLNYFYDGKLKTSFFGSETTAREYFDGTVGSILGDSVVKKINFAKYKGEVNLLISEMTFSSAARFADLFKTFSIGKIIGRTTRGFRSHYGEVRGYDLEKTGLGIQISSKFFVSTSGDKEPHGIAPDYEIKINTTDNLFDRFGSDYLLNEAVKYLSK